jgi:cation diffusion facilitator family transporter
MQRTQDIYSKSALQLGLRHLHGGLRHWQGGLRHWHGGLRHLQGGLHRGLHRVLPNGVSLRVQILGWSVGRTASNGTSFQPVSSCYTTGKGTRYYSKHLPFQSIYSDGEFRSRIKYLRRRGDQVDTTILRKSSLQTSQKIVVMAIASNFIMFCGKMYGAVVSSSASMLAESLHSLADMLNETLLLWGIRRSLKLPDGDHPYGFLTEKYAWALVSGCGVFFLGGGVSLFHGISGLFSPAPLGDIAPAFYALGASLAFEMVTLTVAFRHLKKCAQESDMSFLEYLWYGSDSTSIQVFLEDCASVTGVIIAGVFLSLSKYLSLPFLDSFGSISIGMLLSGVAIFLIRRFVNLMLETFPS